MERCCCFRDTKRGSYCCGIYTAIYSLIIIIASAVFIVFAPKWRHDYFYYSEASFEEMRITFIIYMAMATMFLLVSLLLMYGVKKDNRYLLIPWMVWVIFMLVLNVISIIFIIIAAIHNPKEIIKIFSILIFFLINLYCFRCVYSQYKVIQEEEASRARFYKIKDISGPL